MVEFSTIHHVGFAVGVAGILFAAKCLFDIADSTKRLVAAWVPEDEEEDEEAFDEADVPSSTTTNPTEGSTRSVTSMPSSITIVQSDKGTSATFDYEPGPAHVNPDLTIATKPEAL